MITCTRVIEWDAGHRVYMHEGKCAHLHGHRYRAEFTARSMVPGDGLDKIGRVVDFGVLKAKIGTWIDENWDHKTLLWTTDPMALKLAHIDKGSVAFVGFNPTAENIANHLLFEVAPTLLSDHGDIKVCKVVVWETPNCCAEAEAP